MPRRRVHALLLVLVLLLTICIPFVSLFRSAMPLTVDEAYNGVDALRAIDAGPTLFFAANNGREPLYILLAAISTAVFGPSAVALRLPAAIAGVLRVLVAYGLVRTVLADEDGELRRFVALAAALTVAVSLWGLVLSRLALRVGLLPLLVSVCIWWLWWALRDSAREPTCVDDEPTALRRALRLAAFVGAGVAAGLTVYTYLAWRLVPVLILALLVHIAWQRRTWLRRGKLGLLLAALSATVIAAPMWVYFRTHAVAVNLRVDQVSALGGDRSWPESLALISQNVWRTAGMFSVRGDAYDLYNVLARPVFPVVLAAFLLLGALVAVHRWRNPAYGLWLWWVVLFALPGILADRTPHFARQVGVMPAVFVLPSLGLWASWSWARARAAATRGPTGHGGDTDRMGAVWSVAAVALVAAYVVGAIAPTLRDGVVPSPTHLTTPTDLLRCACLFDDAWVALAASEQVSAATSYASNRDPRLKASHGFHSVVVPWQANPRAVFLLEEDWYTDRAEAGLRGLFDLESWDDRAVPDGFRAFRIDKMAGGRAHRPTPYVRTDLGTRLHAFDLPAIARPGDVATLSLLWSVQDVPLDDPGEDYTWFVHLIDEEHRVVAQHDWLGYPTHAWQAGDRVLSWFDLQLPDDVPCGPLHVEIGMYSRATGARVGLEWSPVQPGLDQAPQDAQRNDRAIFGTLDIECGDGP